MSRLKSRIKTLHKKNHVCIINVDGIDRIILTTRRRKGLSDAEAKDALEEISSRILEEEGISHAKRIFFL